MSPLFRFLAASTLPALLVHAAFIDTTSYSQVWEGFRLLMTLTVTSLWALPGTVFHERLEAWLSKPDQRISGPSVAGQTGQKAAS